MVKPRGKNAKRQAVHKEELRQKADAEREADAKRAKGPPLTPPLLVRGPFRFEDRHRLANHGVVRNDRGR